MTSEPPRSDELFELLSELVDGGLTASRSNRLREWLRDDTEAQDLYLKFMGLHAQLHLDDASGSGTATEFTSPPWSGLGLIVVERR